VNQAEQRAKNSGTAEFAVPEWHMDGGCCQIEHLHRSNVLATIFTAAITLALALLFSGTLAAAVAGTTAGSTTMAIAIALVHVALAGAFVAAAAAFLAARAGVGSLGEGESAGEEQAGDKGDDSFCFHVVNFYWFQFVVSRTDWPVLQ